MHPEAPDILKVRIVRYPIHNDSQTLSNDRCPTGLRSSFRTVTNETHVKPVANKRAVVRQSDFVLCRVPSHQAKLFGVAETEIFRNLRRIFLCPQFLAFQCGKIYHCDRFQLIVFGKVGCFPARISAIWSILRSFLENKILLLNGEILVAINDEFCRGKKHMVCTVFLEIIDFYAIRPNTFLPKKTIESKIV